MLLLLYQVCRIAVLKAGPQHLPNRLDLLAFAIAASCLTGVVMSGIAIKDQSVSANLGRAAFSILLHAAFLYALLGIFKKQERFIKVATAWFGVQALFNLMTTPVLLLTGIDLSDPQSLQTPAIALFLVPSVWYIVIAVYLIKESLSFNIPGAILAFLCLTFIEFVLFSLLFVDVGSVPSLGEPASLSS